MKRSHRLIISIASGIAAVALAVLYASGVQADAERAQSDLLSRYGGDVVKVCIASRDIDPGERLDETSVRMEEWVASLLPDDAQTSMRSVAGKVATSHIPKNAVISPVYFEAKTSSISVPKGKVAVSVATDEEHAVGGAIAPGDYVDVYVSKDGVADRLCGARVIDTSAAEAAGDAADITWATLAVKAENVKEFLAASARGTISLVMPAPVGQTGKGGDA